MTVTPAPSSGAVLARRGVSGRALRVAAHPELGLVVLSIWQGERCVATVRLAENDVPDLVHALAGALLPQVRPVRAVG